MNKKILSFTFLLFCMAIVSAQIANTPENADPITKTSLRAESD